MDPQALRERFDRDGFVLVPGVIGAEQVAALRAFWMGVLDEGPTIENQCANARSNIYARYPEVRWLLAHPPITAALRGLLGEDFVYLHECSVHDEGYARWHKDTSSQEANGHRFHLEPGYRIAQCALYLQPNGEWGGGVDVNPGSHTEPDHYVDRSLADQADALEPYTVPNAAGDLIVFHTRINHQATQPISRPVPAAHRKLAMFILAGPNDVQVDRYHEWIATRDDYGYMKDPVDPGLLEFARANGLHYGPRTVGLAHAPS